MPPSDALPVASPGTSAAGLGGPPLDGLRMVTRENGRCIDLMPSPLSYYLLPPLADASLVRREARQGPGALRFSGGVVELSDEIHDLDAAESILSAVDLPTLGRGIAAGAVFALVFALLTRRGAPTAPSSLATTPPFGLDVPGSASMTLEPLAADAPISAIATRVARLSGLSDERLADLLNVERETFLRWRSGALPNPRIGNRRRLGLLLGLFEELATHTGAVKDWLLNFVTPSGLTPYELLAQGRIDDVAYLAASLDPGARPDQRDAARHLDLELEPLQFGDDDTWDYELSGDDEQK